MRSSLCALAATTLIAAGPVAAATFFFSTGNPDGLMATASRPAGNGKIEIESADDFVLPSSTALSSATFTGLLVGGATPADVSQVLVEIYRVFPSDSDVNRTSGPPTFSTPNVPTRVNSPSDVAFDDLDSAAATLTFTTNVLNTSFSAGNSVLNGINKKPNQTTGGEGSVAGEEVAFNVTFATPVTLGAGHYFLVPQVLLNSAGSEFYWLSAPKPIVPPGTPFAPDLQEWIRNANLDPDWLRVGTDIVGGTPAPTFNAAFSLTGDLVAAVPEPATVALCTLGLLLGAASLRGRRSLGQR